MAVEPVSGQLLIAGPTLLDPNFQRTVVLMIEHGPEGALGLVLNRTSESAVGEAVSELEGLLEPDSPVFVGGPVQPSGLIVLARFLEPDAAALLSFGDVGILRAEASLGDPPDGARASSTTRWSAETGSWNPRQWTTRSPRTLTGCGRTCWPARAGRTRSWPGCHLIRR
jgi:putative transcriptional regulator